MWFNFWKKKEKQDSEPASVWKCDFSGCVAADYLPSYSVCQTEDRHDCRHLVRYSSMNLCSHSAHKSFIPEGAEQFDPHKGQFSD